MLLWRNPLYLELRCCRDATRISLKAASTYCNFRFRVTPLDSLLLARTMVDKSINKQFSYVDFEVGHEQRLSEPDNPITK